VDNLKDGSEVRIDKSESCGTHKMNTGQLMIHCINNMGKKYTTTYLW